MSNADYSVRASGGFCPVAQLSAAAGPTDAVLTISNLHTVTSSDFSSGMAVLVDDEIMKFLGFDASGNVVVLRGCADTVPAAHASGAAVWFFESAVVSDRREYLGTETIGVKVLVSTTTRQMPMDHSPPVTVAFSQRFIRPYPPAYVKAGSLRWHSTGLRLTAADPSLVLTWRHRNRVTQMDVLVGHDEASVTPEAGTTYRLRLFTAGNTLVRTIAGVTTTSLTYSRPEAVADFGLVAFADSGDYPAYALLDSMRDGYASLQSYRINFAIDTTGLSTGRLLMETGDFLLLESGDRILLEP